MQITWEWFGSTVGTVLVTAFVTAVVVKMVGKRNGNSGKRGRDIDRVMLDKLDQLCQKLAPLESLPASSQRQVELLAEIKGLLSIR